MYGKEGGGEGGGEREGGKEREGKSAGQVWLDARGLRKMIYYFDTSFRLVLMGHIL